MQIQTEPDDPRQPVRWSAVQRRLHWGVAAVVLVQYLTQGVMRDAMVLVEAQQAPGFGAFMVNTLHVWGGAAAGLLVFWRLRLRSMKRLRATRGWRPVAALVNHMLLYLLMLVMAISGLLHYGLEIGLAARVHETGKWLLAASLSLHLAGALWHGIVRRDGVLPGMLGVRLLP